MGRIRSTVTVVCFVVFTIVSSLAALQTIRAGLPETPSTSGAAILIEHLSEIQLVDEPRTTKRHVAHRVMRELRDDVDWQPDVSELPAGQQKQLVDNLAVLAQEIIEEQMDTYFSLPERAQRQFINRHIDEVMRWAVMLDRATRKPGENTIRMTAIVTLMARLNKWYTESDPQQQKRLQLFQRAFQEQMTDRMKRGMQPGG